MAESWRHRKTLILGRSDMVGLLAPAEYVDCVEHAFRMHGLGRVYMEPKGHIVLDRYRGEWEVMPSWIEEPEAAACKWVSIREDNSRYELPAVFSILVYTHPETGFPLAICDGSHHTLMRTGASAAVSAKWLARKDSKVLAILGSGSVGKGTLATCDSVFDWGEVRIWSRTQESLDRFVAAEQSSYPHLELRTTTDVEEAVRGADVIALVTSSHEPVIERAWVSPGAHINAVGACFPTFRELDTQTVVDSRFYVDRRESAENEAGDFLIPLHEGVIDHRHIVGEIGDVLIGTLPGRGSAEEITVFESQGLAIEDLFAAEYIVRRARERGRGVTVEF